VRGSLITSRRLAIAGVCLLSLVICTGLAWWQWQRFESATGSWQNLGYVLQWPLFGLFPAFLFWRLRRLRAQHTAEAGTTAPAEARRTGPDLPPVPATRRPAAAVRDDDEDPELAAYNRYLAQLNAADQERR
jgi:DNA-binding transcriptional regulator of glucitol operon